jgi:hypothetical protein
MLVQTYRGGRATKKGKTHFFRDFPPFYGGGAGQNQSEALTALKKDDTPSAVNRFFMSLCQRMPKLPLTIFYHTIMLLFTLQNIKGLSHLNGHNHDNQHNHTGIAVEHQFQFL